MSAETPMEPLFKTRHVDGYWAGRGFVKSGLVLWIAPLKRHVRVLPIPRSWLA